ncbi:hypothetical protein QJQ45_023408, partial [Haematococcus lacustris]
AELVEGGGGAEQGRRRSQWLRVAGLALRLAQRCPALPRLDCLMLRGDLAWEQAADATAPTPLHPPPTHSHPADDSSPYPLSTLTTTITTTSSVSPPVFSASSLLAQARDAYQAAVLLQLHSHPPAPTPCPPPSPSHPAARDPDPSSAGPLTDSPGLPPAVPPALLLPGSEEGEGRAWLLRGGLRAVALYLQAGQAEAAEALAGNLAALMPESGSVWEACGRCALARSPPDLAAALAALEEGNARDPEDGQLWASLALRADSVGRWADGQAALEQALGLARAVAACPTSSTARAPDQPAELLQAGWGAAGGGREGKGRLEEGNWPASGTTQAAAASCCQRGEWARAAALLQQALELGADSFQVHRLLAEVWAARQEPAQARQHLGLASQQASSAAQAAQLEQLRQRLLVGA